MPLPLFAYSPSSQNQRVQGFEVPGDEQLQPAALNGAPAETDMDDIIRAAYRQIFNEQQMIAAHRQVTLESQLRNGQITIRDFIRKLLLSDSFRRLNYDTNNLSLCGTVHPAGVGAIALQPRRKTRLVHRAGHQRLTGLR